MALLEVRDVTKKFGELVANDRVSFSVETGAIVGLIGPNGAGKTTIFNCVSGLYPVTSGKIFFDGREITGLPSYRIARMGAVRTFQVVRPLKEMTVFDNVLVGAFLQDANTARARETAEHSIQICGLAEFAGKTSGDLPIGVKKRLELARALATKPRLLMLDEVMAGLTSTEVNTALDLIRTIRKEGITLLIVEHIMEAIMPIADKVVVLDGGVKLAEGPPGEIIHDERVITAYLGEKFSRRLQARKEGADG
ncbi:MAG TPA: ABC transporter ATP-binding protein [Syntrophales bacterium]|nr:ABC transporter ATP-binding protein [Syntrophobacterales bacterium]HQL91488.1 ABC transporter ATP-binding protein [Syntrophales bacterium]